jgi:3-oxoacyl-[acyl-carrier-protein] synthase II
MSKRILITGLGVVSTLGNSISSFWAGLLKPGAALPTIDHKVKPEYMANRLGYLSFLENEQPVSAAGSASRYALEAARQCLRNAGLEPGPEQEIGVSIGTAMGDTDRAENAREQRKTPLPGESFPYGVSAAVATELGLWGPNLSVSTACSASLYAITLGVDAIRTGAADAMVVGGSEAFSRMAVGCFNRLGALDTQCCRPFDRNRGGTIFGEGAAMLLLESEESVQRRGARVLAEIHGFGWSCDGYNATAPDPSGREFEAALLRAFADAGMGPDAIGCVVPHGTGTLLNDQVESDVLNRVLGERMADIPVCAVKARVGHNGGAAGAFSALTGALIAMRGLVPPTPNVNLTDPGCRVRLVTGAPLEADIRHVLVNASAFGGNNVSLILGKTNANE